MKISETYFDDKMYTFFVKRIKEYYNVKDDDLLLLKRINYLLNLSETNISINNFVNDSDLIPFRFFKLKFEGNNIFKINSININNRIGKTINLSLQCEKYISFLLKMYQNLYEYVEVNSSKINFITNKEAIELEESFSLLLWASRKSTNKIIKDVNICRKAFVKNFFKLELEDLNLKGLKEKDAILIDLSHQNAIAFDCGILKLENKKKQIYSLYLFQVTRKKKSFERLTYISLNDYCNYLAIYFESIYKIKIEKTYFAYIFDSENPDGPTINECEENDINYSLLDKKTLNLNQNLILTEYKSKIKIINSPNYLHKGKNCFMEVEKVKTGDIEKSYEYLAKKRNLIKTMMEEESKLKHMEAKKRKKKSN